MFPSSRAIVVAALLAATIPSVAVAIGAVRVAEELDRPISLASPPGDDRLFVVEQAGRIVMLDQDGDRLGTFLDIEDRLLEPIFGERGLLGLAFSPTFTDDGLFYVHYVASDGSITVSRFQTRLGLADSSSEEVLIRVPRQFDDHNGGQLGFGPDGMLYVGLGDGGGRGDPFNHAQRENSLLGKILRIDVSGGSGSGYSIPVNNPLTDRSPAAARLVRTEIWASGLRNPRSFGFDPRSGDLYVADRGETTWEEVNVQPHVFAGGANYGWRRMEGDHCVEPAAGCNDASLTAPIYEYSRDGSSDRCAIVGGAVYRGSEPSIQGQYFFADYCSHEVWSLSWDGADGVRALFDRTAELQPDAGELVDLSRICGDDRGNVYLLSLTRGEVFRLDGDSAAVSTPEVASIPIIQVAAPNPFRSATSITLALPEGETAEVRVLDFQGRLVRTLAQGVRGERSLIWDGRDDNGRTVAPGVYIVSVDAGRRVHRMGITLLR